MKIPVNQQFLKHHHQPCHVDGLLNQRYSCSDAQFGIQLVVFTISTHLNRAATMWLTLAFCFNEKLGRAP